jgi:hypothetical protein
MTIQSKRSEFSPSDYRSAHYATAAHVIRYEAYTATKGTSALLNLTASPITPQQHLIVYSEGMAAAELKPLQ